MGTLVAGWAGVGAVGAGGTRLGRGVLAGGLAAAGGPVRPTGYRGCPDGGNGECGHGRGRAGRPPAPPPGRLAAAGLRPLVERGRGGWGVCALRAPGPARGAAGRRLGGHVLPGHRPAGAGAARPGAAADADRVAAVARLALVGVAHGGGAGRAAAGHAAGPQAAGGALPGGRQPVRPASLRRGAAVGQPGPARRHRSGRPGRGRVAGGAVPPPAASSASSCAGWSWPPP
jgi:hypothetical protein